MKLNLNIELESAIILEVLLNLELSELKKMVADCREKIDEILIILTKIEGEK